MTVSTIKEKKTMTSSSYFISKNFTLQDLYKIKKSHIQVNYKVFRNKDDFIFKGTQIQDF